MAFIRTTIISIHLENFAPFLTDILAAKKAPVTLPRESTKPGIQSIIPAYLLDTVEKEVYTRTVMTFVAFVKTRSKPNTNVIAIINKKPTPA